MILGFPQDRVELMREMAQALVSKDRIGKCLVVLRTVRRLTHPHRLEGTCLAKDIAEGDLLLAGTTFGLGPFMLMQRIASNS